MNKKYDIIFMRVNVTVWPKCIDDDYMNVNYGIRKHCKKW